MVPLRLGENVKQATVDRPNERTEIWIAFPIFIGVCTLIQFHTSNVYAVAFVIQGD